MTKRFKLRVWIWAALICLMGFPGERAQAAARPNIIVIVADDLRWDALGFAGNRIVQTPNLDGLSKNGVRFRNHFVTSSICNVSRASMFTGQYLRRHKIIEFDTPFTPQQWGDCYPRLLRDAGYQVEVSRLAKPKLRQGDLALGFLVKESRSTFGGPSQAPEDTPTKKALRTHVDNGGRALILQVPNDFVGASKLAFRRDNNVKQLTKSREVPQAGRQAASNRMSLKERKATSGGGH